MEVLLTGPTGRKMLLPEQPKDLILICTGTGIAPFRAYLRRLFYEDTPTSRAWLASACTVTLFAGFQTPEQAIYADEWAKLAAEHPSRFRVEYAFSRAESNSMYVQDRVAMEAAALLEAVHGGAIVYCCGLKAMMVGVHKAFEGAWQDEVGWADMAIPYGRGVGRARGPHGECWLDTLAKLKAEGRWHVEVY